MKVYNTLTRQKEELKTIVDGEVRIYACGPTVYNLIHIGNARPLCVFDVLRRYLEWRGQKVIFIQNFTDIDDKIIRRANQENVDFGTIAERYIKEYNMDARGLNVKQATAHPKATENIDQIIEFISGLVENQFAYRATNGDVYFRARRFEEYGKLSNQPLDELESGARVEVGDLKEDDMDFALWKAAKPGEPFWPSPWGDGRPGWHIECSVMARRYLGDTIDIHCGGQDLIFPHHENEIAQSEAFCGVPFARYWLHNGYINVDNKKMSKSLDNFFTVRDVAKEYGYEPIRFFLIASHYRSPINYNTEIIEQSKAALDRLYTCRENLLFALENADRKTNGTTENFEMRRTQFINAMEDDLNTADAIAALFEFVRDINKAIVEGMSPGQCKKALDIFDDLCRVLGLIYNTENEALDSEIEDMIEKRNLARDDKNWAEADRLRDKLKSMGITLEDTPQGVKWHRSQL